MKRISYAGIEHRQTQDVYQCLKLITRPGCERIVRYAFEYARAIWKKEGDLHGERQHYEVDRWALP